MGFLGDIFGNFGSDLVDGFIGTDTLKDFSHASKLMRPGGHALAPNHKFLFHVYFTLNTQIPGVSDDKGLVGALVKSVQLPSFDIAAEEYVQYNRKRIVNNRITYRPVEIALHDDARDTVRSMWSNYYTYYFDDSKYNYESSQGSVAAYNPRNIYNPELDADSWGVSNTHSRGGKKIAFFKDIKIYGMSRGNYVLYTLINPSISTWTHDTYDYEQSGGIMEHKMSIKYEAVKYGRGRVSDGILGFAEDSRYDNSPSPLGKAGSTASIFGTGGALDAGAGIFEDLSNGNILGAIKKGGTTYRTFKDKSVKDIFKQEVKQEVANELPGVISNIGKNSGILYPKSQQSNTHPTVNRATKATPVSGSN